MNNTQTRYIEEDEIDLRELWHTLMEHKLFIAIFTSVITFMAIGWAFTRTPIYEVKSNLQIGFTTQNTKESSSKILLEDSSTLVKTLTLVFNVDDKLSTKKDFVSEVSSISASKKLKNFIEIKTEAISNDEALKKNKEVVKYIQSKYQPKIDQFILDNKNKIELLKLDIENIKNNKIKKVKEKIVLLKTQDVVKIDKKIDFYKKVTIPTLEKKVELTSTRLDSYTKAIKSIYKKTKSSLTSSLQIMNYQTLILNAQNSIEDLKLKIDTIKLETIPTLEVKKENLLNNVLKDLNYKLNVELPNEKRKLEKEIEQLNSKNSTLNVQNSKVIGRYIVYDYPVKPKKKLIIVVAFITGLILSIFLVFFLEFIKKDEEITGGTKCAE